MSDDRRPAHIDWIRGPAPDTPRLDRWRAAVGPPLHHAPSDPPAPALPDIAFLSWNVAVGAGDPRPLIADLRDGRLACGPRHHFVLLLQEAVRLGGAPEEPPSRALCAGRLPRRHGAERTGIGALAAAEGFHLFYVPSMRNGGRGAPAEDRGNAILSTLPLHSLRAVELPLERQRRVALEARLRTRPDPGPAEVRLVTTHFDHSSGITRPLRSLGRGRLRQARWLLDSLEPATAGVLGGDLNSWKGQAAEPAVRLLRTRFPDPDPGPAQATAIGPLGLPFRRVDHLMFRLPEPWRAEVVRLDHPYGSDHFPLLAVVR